jgi:hypothetical protein
MSATTLEGVNFDEMSFDEVILNGVTPTVLHRLRGCTPRARLRLGESRYIAFLIQFITGIQCPVTEPDMDDLLVMITATFTRQIRRYIANIDLHNGQGKLKKHAIIHEN